MSTGVSGGGQEAGPWPALPPDCPPSGAGPKAGMFYRLLKGAEHDWRTHAMLGKPCPAAVGQCRWQSLSVFDSVDGLHRLIRRVGRARFEGHRPMSFSLDETMGDLLAGSHGHHDWWPSAAFVPPPSDLHLAADEDHHG